MASKKMSMKAAMRKVEGSREDMKHDRALAKKVIAKDAKGKKR